MKIDKLRGKITKEWIVHFEDPYTNFECPPFYATVNVFELYQDWYGNCVYCPENYAEIFNIMLGDDNGKIYLIERGEDFDFEKLMRFIEIELRNRERGE